MTATDTLSWLACVLVLASMSATSFRTCRMIAIGSNLVFIAYGLSGGAAAILALHLALLVINTVRIAQMRRDAAQP